MSSTSSATAIIAVDTEILIDVLRCSAPTEVDPGGFVLMRLGDHRIEVNNHESGVASVMCIPMPCRDGPDTAEVIASIGRTLRRDVLGAVIAFPTQPARLAALFS